MTEILFERVEGDSPILATAIHNGHNVREDLAKQMLLSEEDRLREEDPYTGRWTEVVDNRIVLDTSRFEIDLNRPRDKAMYATPADAWGLKIWKEDLSGEQIETSLEIYDQFYSHLKTILDDMKSRHGKFVVYDIHSYNHRRNGPDAPDEDPELNPEVNVGTGSMNKNLWGGVLKAFNSAISTFDYQGRKLDARENIKFKGGWLSQWIHQNYPESGCCFAIEFKKFFMDEWTGKPFEDHMVAVKNALNSTVEPVLDELKKVPVK